MQQLRFLTLKNLGDLLAVGPVPSEDAAQQRCAEDQPGSQVRSTSTSTAAAREEARRRQQALELYGAAVLEVGG